MPYEWDENKRQKTIEKHGLDFIDGPVVMAGPTVVGKAKLVEGESRWLATGLLDDVYVTLIYTVRGDVIRIISFRRARDDERKRHQELHGG